jgi:hypothetical protein
MKAPDLAIVDDAGVQPWTGSAEPLKTAAAHAHLKLATVDLAHAKDRAALFAELDRALKLPSISATTGTRSPTCSRTATGSGRAGRVIVFHGSAAYRREHPTDWTTLEDIFAEASEFWKERHLAFWIFTS